MIGSTIVFLCAVAIVAAYMFTVNRMLRSDEHWSESGDMAPPAPAAKPAFPIGRLARA